MYDIWLLKTDANGDTLWTKIYGGTNDDDSYEIQLTTDGGFIITGWTESFGAGDADVWLLKIDSLGDTLWTKTYGGTQKDVGASIKQTPDGGYIVTGLTFSFGAGLQDVYLIKTDSLGDTLWTRTYGGADRDAATSVQLTSDKGYILAGGTRSYANISSYDAYLIKTDSLGDTLWTKTYGNDGHTDFFESVKQTFDNGYIMTGFTTSYGDAGELYLVRTDENGDTLWARHWGNQHNMDYGYEVIQIPDSNYIVAGYYSKSLPHDHYTDVWVLKVSDAGDTLWTMKYTRFGADSVLEDWVYEVQRTFDGGYVLAGQAGGWLGGYVYLIKTAPDTLGVQENHIAHLPLLSLEVYPNPFKEITDIRYQLASEADSRQYAVGSIRIYDISGSMVKNFSLPTTYSILPTTVSWDGTDSSNRKLPSGVYFVSMKTEKAAITRKVLLLR
jgi:hypothetical protein